MRHCEPEEDKSVRLVGLVGKNLEGGMEGMNGKEEQGKLAFLLLKPQKLIFSSF